MVKEYYEAPVCPLPFSLIENLLDTMFASDKWRRGEDQAQHWGRHYTWPVSTMEFSLEMARRRLLAKKQILRAATLSNVLTRVHDQDSAPSLRGGT
eukprot:SAG31_NODE_25947_length_451_cov_0.735795_1_plen_96_part_01